MTPRQRGQVAWAVLIGVVLFVLGCALILALWRFPL